MKTKLLKRMFVVCLSLAIAASPITANAATRKDSKIKGIKPAPSVLSSADTELKQNNKNVFPLTLNSASNSGSSKSDTKKKKATFYVQLDPGFGMVCGASATLTGWCISKSSGNKIAARFDTSFYFVNSSDGVHSYDNAGTVTSSKNKNASEYGYYNGRDYIKRMYTCTYCSKKTYTAKTLTCDSTNPY